MDKRSEMYHSRLEHRAAARRGLRPATNHSSYTFRQSCYMHLVCSQSKQENTEKHTESYNVWQPQNLNGTLHKSKTETDSWFPHSWMSTKAWRIGQGSLNVLNPSVYFGKIITVKAVLPTGAPWRSLLLWSKLFNRPFSCTPLTAEGRTNRRDNDLF